MKHEVSCKRWSHGQHGSAQKVKAMGCLTSLTADYIALIFRTSSPLYIFLDLLCRAIRTIENDHRPLDVMFKEARRHESGVWHGLAKEHAGGGVGS